MAINVSLAQLTTLNNTSILGQINSNNAILQTALTDAVSRSGQSPNNMTSPLDMNSNQIFNLPPPSTGNSPARLNDVTSTTIPVAFPTLIGDVTGTVNIGTGNTTTTVQNVSTAGSIKASAMPALTGDVTMPAGSTVTTLATGNAGNLNSGTLLAARMPALTGDVTTTVNTVASTISNNVVSNTKLAQATANTLKGNPTGSTSNITDTVAPVLGNNGGTGGSVTLNGATSGSCIVKVATAAGTSTNFQLPPTNGLNTNVLQTDGAGNTSWVATASASSGSLRSKVVYSGSQTITIPTSPNATQAAIQMWGGSGGSSGASAGFPSGGTGAAGYLEKYLTGLTAGNTVVYTQGAAGSAGASTPTAGGNGSASTLVSGTQTITTLTANGSNGGPVNTGGGTAGGTATNGDVNITGVNGTAGFGDGTATTSSVGAGGGSLFSPGTVGVFTVGANVAGIAGHSGGLIISWFT